MSGMWVVHISRLCACCQRKSSVMFHLSLQHLNGFPNVFLNRNLTNKTRVTVYKAIWVSTLLDGRESGVPYRHHLRILERFHVPCQKRNLGLYWWYYMIRHCRLKFRCVSIQLLSKLCLSIDVYVGMVTSSACLITDSCNGIFFGCLKPGKRVVSRQYKRYRDHIRAIQKTSNIFPSQLKKDWIS